MVNSHSVVLAATAVLFAAVPSLAYEWDQYHEARDLIDYSEHMARDVDLSELQFEAREPAIDFITELDARDTKKEAHKPEHHDHDHDHKHKGTHKHKDSHKHKKGGKKHKSHKKLNSKMLQKLRLHKLKKTCAKLQNQQKDECTKEYNAVKANKNKKEKTTKTKEALKKYGEMAKKAKEDAKKKKAEEKKKKAEEKKKAAEEKKKAADEKKKKAAEEKKKMEEEKKKQQQPKPAGHKREVEYDTLQGRDLGYETLLWALKRAYNEDLEAREYFDSLDALD